MFYARPGVHAIDVQFYYRSDDSAANITGGSVSTIGNQTDTDAGVIPATTITQIAANKIRLTWAATPTIGAVLDISTLGNLTFDRAGFVQVALIQINWPDWTGSITDVTVDGGDPTVVHWTFDANCVLSAADTGPLQIDDGGGLQSPTALLGISGQTFDLQYASPQAPGNAWECASQPAAVDVPGGYLTVPENGNAS